MTGSKSKPALRAPEDCRSISRNEILDVMANEGYSADDRKTWLKDVLTSVSKAVDGEPDPEREKLMNEIREILHGQVSENPQADDKA